MSTFLNITFIIMVLRMSTSLTLASLGGMICERSGVMNIALEGMMLVGAFAGVLGSYLTGNPYIGILFALIFGGLMGLLLAFLSVTLAASQSIAGMGINLLGAGLTAFWLRAIFKVSGSTEQVASLQTSDIFANIPLIGNFMRQLPMFIYATIILVVLFHIIFNKTALGLRIKACGENPAVADTLGINVILVRYWSCIVCGMLAGFSGSFLSLGQMNLFQENMTSGRGYIAVATIILGRWTPFGSLGACLLFGFFDALQLKLQTLQGIPLPPEILLLLPYTITVLVVAIFVSNSGKPAMVGKYYDRNLR